MAKQNFNYEKRQRELDKKKKQEEKRQRRFERKNPGGGEEGDTQAGEGEEPRLD